MERVNGYQRLFDGLYQLLAPPLCPGCDLSLRPGESGFCSACGPLIEATPHEFRPPAKTAAGYIFGGPLADAIRRYKYHGRTEYTAVLGRLLCRVSLPYASRIDCIIPVPLHPKRLRERGFNQSALLARTVSRSLGIGLDIRSLQRIRNTSEQAYLSKSERSMNVKGAFLARMNQPPKRVLLIDDIRTTGATFASAAVALLDAGVVSVYSLALAHTEPH